MTIRISRHNGTSHNGHSVNRLPSRILHIETERTVTTHQDLSADLQTAQGPTLATIAGQPGIDPCDVAEDAMPGLVIGDLTPCDETWVHQHTSICAYCANMLESFEQCDAVLDAGNAVLSRTADQRPPETAALLGLKRAEFGFMDTPVGLILIAMSDTGVCEISFLRHRDKYIALRQIEERGILAHEKQVAVKDVVSRLEEYFHGNVTPFRFPVDLYGLSEFTRKVLNATGHIPFGNVTTYGDVARAIGNPGSSRAVGNALGRNPVPVIVPCHRVVLANGDMGWYTGGADIKHELLMIEGVTTPSGVVQQPLRL